MRTRTKSLLVEKYFHLRNRDLARLLYGEVNDVTVRRVRVLRSKLRKRNSQDVKAYNPVSYSSSFQFSFNDLKHYEVTTPFHHDTFNDLNTRYLADISRFVNSRTMRDGKFETTLFQYLQYYLQYLEKNEKGHVKLYVDTNNGVLRGHHRNKALLYYLLIMIYCKHYRCPDSKNRELFKEVIFSENEDVGWILSLYRPSVLDILSKEIFS